MGSWIGSCVMLFRVDVTYPNNESFTAILISIPLVFVFARVGRVSAEVISSSYCDISHTILCGV